MKIKLISIIVFFFLINAYGENSIHSLSQYINKENLDTLLSKGEVSSILRKNELPHLIPEIKAKSRIIEETKEIDPVIGVEILLLYNTDKNFIQSKNSEFPDLYNVLQAISTLKGIEYYSASRKRMRIFYNDAYTIESPENKKRIKDPYFHVIPEKNNLYAYLKDSSFGEYICYIKYYFDNYSFIMEMENMTKIWYYFIPLIDPHKLQSYTIIIPLENEILFYGFSCLKTSNMFGLADKRIASLYNRIKAIYNWFCFHYK